MTTTTVLPPAPETNLAQSLEQFRENTHFGWIPLSAMFAAAYERPISKTRVEQILANWDIRAVGTLYLSQRKSNAAREPATYSILDGRHRVAAAEQKGIDELPCLIYSGLTYQQEAILYVQFATVNQQGALDRFRARLEAGDPTALDLKHLVETETPMQLPLNFQVGGSGGYLNAVFTMERIVNDYGRNILVETFRVNREVWGNLDRAWSARFLLGVSSFLVRYESYASFDRSRLVSQLKQLTPESLIARAHLLASATGRHDSRSALGMAILEHYNDMLRGRRLPPWSSRIFARTPEGEGVSFSDDGES